MITSQAPPKSKPPLWFWIIFIVVATLTLISASLYITKYTRLSIAAKQDQTPLVQQRDKLLNVSDLLQSNWLKTLNPQVKKVQGDLLWSSQQQKGFMRFFNLPLLSSTQHYHLWIYDLEHSLKEPISATRFQADPHIRKEFLVEI
jgi:Na+-transporting NADH:ubiquinone oxidoreductase subunit NqrC